MRRIYGYLLMISLLVLATAAPALADTYFIYDQYGGTWHDANKTSSPDDNLMCWAAAASNILDYGKWDAASYNTETKIFQYFVDHWTDSTGYMAWAWNWWFTGAKPPTSLYAHPDVSGGDFFPALNFKNYFAYASTGNLMQSVDNFLHKGDGVTITIRNGSMAHAVTVWGYSTGTNGVYNGIYITDSDDGVAGLRNYSLTLSNSVWYLGGGYSGWKISDVEALGFFASPSLGAMTLAGDSTNPVPIAPSWLLFGTGIIPFFIKRRRRPEKTGGSCC